MATVYVAVTLYVKKGREADFERYERAALMRARGYGAKLLHRLRCAAEARGTEAPYELHLLEFPSEAALDALSSANAAFEEERDQVIERAEVVTGLALESNA